MSDTALFAMQSHVSCHESHDQQPRVSDLEIHFSSSRQSLYYIASHEQVVSESALSFFQAVPSQFFMINRKWVTLPIFC